MDWYYSEHGELRGPVSEAEMRDLAARGIVSHDTLVWRTGMPQCVPAASVAGLLSPPPLPPVSRMVVVPPQSQVAQPTSPAIAVESRRPEADSPSPGGPPPKDNVRRAKVAVGFLIGLHHRIPFRCFTAFG